MGVRTTEPTELASGVWRLGTDLVNWYLVEDGGRLTVVDAGAPKYQPQLDVALGWLGRSVGDLAAIVLTHADSDHTGFAEALREETGVPVYVHADDESLAAAGKPYGKNEASFLPYLRYQHTWRLLAHLAGALNLRPAMSWPRSWQDRSSACSPGATVTWMTSLSTAQH